SIKPHDNGNRVSSFLGSLRIRRAGRDNDVHVETNQLGRKIGQSIEFSLCISVLNDNVFPLHVTEVAQTLAEGLGAGRDSGRKRRNEESYARELHWLLRLGWRARSEEQG